MQDLTTRASPTKLAPAWTITSVSPSLLPWRSRGQYSDDYADQRRASDGVTGGNYSTGNNYSTGSNYGTGATTGAYNNSGYGTGTSSSNLTNKADSRLDSDRGTCILNENTYIHTFLFLQCLS